MPLIRKLIKLRTSRAVCLPKDWLDDLEFKHGVKIDFVELEVNGKLQISPHFTK